MATRITNIVLQGVDKATGAIKSVSAGMKTLTKAVDDYDKKHKSMSSSVSAGITQAIGPYVAFSKVFQSLGKSVEEFEKRTGKTSGLSSLKASMTDISAQIGASLYPAFEDLAKIVDTNKDKFLKFGAQVGTIFTGLIDVVKGFSTFFSSAILSGISVISEKFYGLKAIILDVFRDKKGAQEARAMAQAIASEFESANAAMVTGLQDVAKGSKTIWAGISGDVKINAEATKRVAKEEEDTEWKKLATVVAATNKKTKYIIETREKIAAFNRAANEKELQEAIDADNKQHEIIKKTRESFSKELQSVEFDNLSKTYSGRLEVVKRQIDAEQAYWAEQRDAGIISKEEYDAYELELEQSKQDSISEIRFAAADNYLSMASQVASQISTINSMVSEQQLSDLDEETKKKKEVATATIKNRKVLEKEIDKIDKEAEKKKKEIAKREKQIALIGSIINTAQAVTGALAATPGPVGIAMAVIVGVLGAIQTGIIASQAFAQGGVVQPEAGKSSTGDNILIRANPGERILTKEQNRAYEMGSTSGITIGDTHITINGNADEATVARALKKSREDQMYEMRSLMLEMKSNNMLPMAA